MRYDQDFAKADADYQRGLFVLMEIEQKGLDYREEIYSPESFVQDTFAGMRDLAMALIARLKELEEALKEGRPLVDPPPLAQPGQLPLISTVKNGIYHGATTCCPACKSTRWYCTDERSAPFESPDGETFYCPIGQLTCEDCGRRWEHTDLDESEGEYVGE